MSTFQSHEAVILTNYPLSDSDIAEVNVLVANLLKDRERVYDRSPADPCVAGPYIVGVFNTGRVFDLDLRPVTLQERYRDDFADPR